MFLAALVLIVIQTLFYLYIYLFVLVERLIQLYNIVNIKNLIKTLEGRKCLFNDTLNKAVVCAILSVGWCI